MNASTSRVVAGPHTDEQKSRADDRDRHPPEWRREDQQRRNQHIQFDTRQDVESAEPAQDLARREQVDKPPHTTEHIQRHAKNRLQHLHAARGGADAMVVIPGRLWHLGSHRIGHRAQRRMGVDLGHRELGRVLPDPRDQLSCGERPTTEVEEVRRQFGGGNPEHGLPVISEQTLALIKTFTV